MKNIVTYYWLLVLTVTIWRLIVVEGRSRRLETRVKLQTGYQYYSSTSNVIEGKADLPPKYEVVYPYVSDNKGHYRGQLRRCPSSEHRRSRALQKQRQSNSNRLYVTIKLPNEKLVLHLRPNKKLMLNRPQVEFLDETGNMKRSFISETSHYVGRVKNRKNSSVSLSNCNGRLSGLIRTSTTDYLIEPLNEKQPRQSRKVPHIIYGVEAALTWKNVSTLDDILQPRLRHEMKRDTWSFDEDDQIFINASTRLYLETLVAVDTSVVKFHGDESSTAEYIMTIMNIVSTIYEDAALNANLHIVVSKILIVNESKHNISIVKGDNKISLESVCKLSSKVKAEDNIDFDITIYLTRNDIGDVAGFAPLLSICDSANSCTVTRDDGLTSAFILAHEIAHVLGLSHDGDEQKGNNCLLENNQHSIMAPTVQSNFNRYYWSNCSVGQFHKQREMWFCMKNKPKVNVAQVGLRNSPSGSVYTLDEQCRQEFGNGHRHCKQYKAMDPCQILWCSPLSKKAVCLTKQKPPLDGTQCGENKCCQNGHCIKSCKRKHRSNTIYRNPRHGGWGEWGPYGHCSRSCGGGVRFRTRECNRPEPAHGGQRCKGEREEFQICNTQKCPEVKDFRGEQCKTYGRHHPHLWNSKVKNNQLVPLATNGSITDCKLFCKSQQTNQTVIGENVVDGTLCSYNNSLDMCVQGSCQRVGCDGVLNSSMQLNSCGICNKNNSYCKVTEKLYSKIPTKRFTRVGVIPKRARHLMIRKTAGAPNFIVLQSRRFREFVLNGGKDQGSSKTFVALGTIFNYKVDNGTEIITTTGPILEEMAVLISVKRWKTTVKIFTNYTMPKNKSLDAIINPDEHYEWKVIGWSKCSRLCGEGIQALKTQCVDKHLQHSVSKRHCSLLDKPTNRKRKCNVFPCRYIWKSAEWEYCSQTCGTNGIQLREVQCVLATDRNEILSSPSHCSAQEKPVEKQQCNNIPCPGTWELGPWSPCSTTCGNGTRYRNMTCIPPENEVYYNCGDQPAKEEACEGPPCKGTNREECVDRTSTCESLTRYCIIESFFNYCCKACNNYINQPNEKTNSKTD